MAKALIGRWKLGASVAAALAAGGTVAACESDKRGPLFDPEALERGAKALKEINASPFAKKVLYARLTLYCIGSQTATRSPHAKLDVLVPLNIWLTINRMNRR